MKSRALIVDDERLARKELISLLTEIKEIEVVGEADDVNSAILEIQKLNPDVIFLDIQMPGKSGFELLEQVDIDAKIIFVTAYDEFAIRAFEVNAIDYLLKPVNPKRLEEAIKRLHESNSVSKTSVLEYNDRLLLTLNNHLKFLKISDIIAIFAAGDYSEILTKNSKKSITLKTMKEWEQRLPHNYFTRIHRSSIINLEYVDKLEEWFNNSYKVYLREIDEPLTISRRYISKIKSKFS